MIAALITAALIASIRGVAMMLALRILHDAAAAVPALGFAASVALSLCIYIALAPFEGGRK